VNTGNLFQNDFVDNSAEPDDATLEERSGTLEHALDVYLAKKKSRAPAGSTRRSNTVGAKAR
jgi:hypothetical protein